MINNVIVIGSGPSGHTAALYLARANLEPIMLEGETSGGLLTTTKTIENFPGFPEGIDGFELTQRFKEQSENFGTVIKFETALEIKKRKNYFEVKTDKNTYKTRTIILATGSTPNRLYVPGYDKFWHNGVSTCAVCDGFFFKNLIVAVVGGGDSAAEEALHLANIAKKVYLIHRRDKLRASKIMINRVMENKNIEIIWNTEVIEIVGKDKVDKLILKTGKKLSKLSVRGVFVAIGHTPNSQFISSLVDTKDGYIVTNRQYETSVKGIWAVGDVQDPYYRQAITAAGSGCAAALEVERWLA